MADLFQIRKRTQLPGVWLLKVHTSTHTQIPMAHLSKSRLDSAEIVDLCHCRIECSTFSPERKSSESTELVFCLLWMFVLFQYTVLFKVILTLLLQDCAGTDRFEPREITEPLMSRETLLYRLHNGLSPRIANNAEPRASQQKLFWECRSLYIKI